METQQKSERITDNVQPSPKRLPISWDRFHQDTQSLAAKINESILKDGQKFKGILAIARGGLIPAAIAATELDIRLVETFCIATYDDDEMQTGETIFKDVDNLGDGTGWLVVDDLVDTGKTFNILKKRLPKAYFAAVYAKPLGVREANCYLTTIDQDIWIEFPWE